LKGDECSTFTDGAGVCGEHIDRRAAHALGFRTGIHSTPSAIQVSYGGYKGVLSVSPEVKPSDIRIRPSMEKFKSPDKVMNVVRVSHFTTETLQVKAYG
jgi:RNA-dependent RNA polymerase